MAPKHIPGFSPRKFGLHFLQNQLKRNLMKTFRIVHPNLLAGIAMCLGILGRAGETPATHTDKGGDRQGAVQIALLLDTSNSMDGLINQAKAQLWDIVNQFTRVRCGKDRQPDLQIALYQYGNDDLPSREGYIQQVIGFTNDLDELSEKLFSLKTNGGEEYCGEVIGTALSRLDWGGDDGNLKLIFIAGNEPFTQGSRNYRDAIGQAREKDVIVNTIFCGNYEQGVSSRWKDGAELGGGDYLAIDHNREIVHVVTPYDDLIIRLNTRLNHTYISFGARGAEKRAQQAAQDANAMEMEAAVAVNRSVSKSSRFYDNASWDLVDAAEKPGFRISDLHKEELPEGLRDQSEDEIAAFIAAKRREREELQAQIRQLNEKRDAFLSQEQASPTGELGSAMRGAIKKQAEKKGFYWE